MTHDCVLDTPLRPGAWVLCTQGCGGPWLATNGGWQRVTYVDLINREQIMDCTCGRIKIGMKVTEQRNWHPACREHGLGTAWWNSPEQVAKREAQAVRSADLQARAKAARKAAREAS